MEKWKDFLSSIGIPDEDLDDYARKLIDNGYESNTTEIFLQVTLNDLIYMGITKNAHQKVILMAISKIAGKSEAAAGDLSNDFYRCHLARIKKCLSHTHLI